MKKFLFTLVALLTAGSICANEYLYIEEQDYTGQTGEVEILVKMHIDYAVSAIQGDFTFPQGMTLVDFIQEDGTKIPYVNARGRNAISNPLFVVDFDHNNFMCAQAELGYYQVDGAWVSHNVVKWLPEDGDFDIMTLIVEIDETFEGGKLGIVSQHSCDSGVPDPRPGVTNCPENQVNSNEFNVGPQETPTPDADMPVITVTENATGKTVDIANYTEFTITIDNVVVENPVLPYFIEAEYDVTKNVVVYAKNAPEGYNAKDDTKEFTVGPREKEQNSTPSVTYSYDPATGELNVWGYGCTEDDVEYMLYCDGVAYNGTFPIIINTEEGYNHTWTATAVSPTTTVSAESAPCEIVIDPVAPEYQTPNPVIEATEDADAQVVHVKVTGEGNLTLRITGLDGVVCNIEGPSPLTYDLPYVHATEGEYYTAYATATADKPGYTVYAGEKTEYIWVPVWVEPTVPELSGDITIGQVDQTNGHFEVTYNGNEAGVELTVNFPAVRAEGVYQFARGRHTVEVVASAPGFQNKTASAERVWKFDVEGAPTITTTMDANTVYVNITWPTTESDGEHVYTGQMTYDRPAAGSADQEFDVEAYIAATDLFNESAHANVTIVVPAKDPQTPAMAPSVNAQITGYETATITITNNQENGTVHYTIIDMATGETIISGEFTGAAGATHEENVTGDGTYRVETYCTAEGYAQSSNTNAEFSIAEGETAVGEILNGKTVANVRYFNMAGQEMQQADGVTIMVTTYTDGTTTTTKVMK